MQVEQQAKPQVQTQPAVENTSQSDAANMNTNGNDNKSKYYKTKLPPIKKGKKGKQIYKGIHQPIINANNNPMNHYVADDEELYPEIKIAKKEIRGLNKELKNLKNEYYIMEEQNLTYKYMIERILKSKKKNQQNNNNENNDNIINEKTDEENSGMKEQTNEDEEFKNNDNRENNTSKKKKSKKNNFFKELAQRWKTPLSKFWKVLRNWAIGIGSAAVAVIGVDKLFDLQTTYGVSPMVFTICGYIIVGAAVLGLTSQITTKHPEQFNKEEDE